MGLETRDRMCLLELAHRSIAAGAGHGLPAPVPQSIWPAALTEHHATFVTLKRSGALRGCRGTVEPRNPLSQDVWKNAWASAYADPRFPPVSGSELALLDISISVLTSLQPLPASSEAALLEALRPGVDGLVLRCGAAVATFLPAVWEVLPDPREFLTQLKLKAGWPEAFWSRAMTAQRYATETFEAPAALCRPGGG